jgi:hypothetical protein
MIDTYSDRKRTDQPPGLLPKSRVIQRITAIKKSPSTMNSFQLQSKNSFKLVLCNEKINLLAVNIQVHYIVVSMSVSNVH